MNALIKNLNQLPRPDVAIPLKNHFVGAIVYSAQTMPLLSFIEAFNLFVFGFEKKCLSTLLLG
jgi:hypothetical protein